ncbi:D-2-hydroxyacid dehydrogenase family protein [Chryseobacterium sp.]|uniref:D-2-hydroxyacid dehydrogenase family protein n=1 Tax=Chryseobacterium sp. TaxID=1871047 RepID=UPI00388E6263
MGKVRITILDDYQNVVKDLACFSLLKNQDVTVLSTSEKEVPVLAEKLKDTEILVLIRERTEITEELLSRLPHLKLISQTGKISNHLKLELCTKYNVSVAEGIGSPIAPSELTWALLMNTVRKIPQAIKAMQQGKWQINMGTSIHGKTIGIWGYGKIGQKIAQYAQVFGAKVLVWGSEKSRNKAVEDGFLKANSKADFFKTADIITLHLRLNEATSEIVKKYDIQMMKDNACFINTARAELVENGAIEEILKSGQKINFGFDVFENEPIFDRNFPLFQYENVVCTPHLGYVEENSYELYFEKAFENVMLYINGNPTNIANSETLN